MKLVSKNAAMEKADFIPDYHKVIRQLDHENFALSGQIFTENQFVVRIPKRFSISEEPDEVIRILRALYSACKCSCVNKIVFDHSACEYLGLSASTIMDIIVCVVKRYKKDKNMPLSLSGKFPVNQIAKDVFLASGLPYHLQISHKSGYDEANVERFETVSGEYGRGSRQSGKIATELTDYFNKCLGYQNMKLNETGILIMATMLGEVLGNCEIHGGEQATWYTQGHYENNPERSYGEMQLLFLNLGDTIYHGLKYDSSKETTKRVSHFVNRHKQYFNTQWTEEMACTVFALQEGISRLRDKDIEGYEGRGTGTVSLIETLNKIGRCEDEQQKPEMTIISGKTFIKFNDRYEMQAERFCNDPAFGSGIKSIIAFNKENNIYKPADQENVRLLRQHFPGTIVSLRIYLDSRYISKEKGGRI